MSGFDALGYYKILQADQTTNENELRRHYRDLAKLWHPDHNTSEEALQNFQKISNAYDILKDEKKRLVYDMLSLVYGVNNYPDIENIKPYEDTPQDINIRFLPLLKVRGFLFKYYVNETGKVCSRGNALKELGLNAGANWLLGWWHPKAFIKNIKAIISNFKYPVSSKESFRVLVHNAVAYFLQENKQLAASSAIIALSYSDNQAKRVLENFIAFQNTKVSRPKAWTVLPLKLIQLIVPFILIAAVCLSFSSRYITDAELWAWLNSKEEINYYQEVEFAGRGSSVDDVVVGKILNIPVDSSDISKLYHVKADDVLMHGPSDDFDVMKKIPAQTTVRLTGYSPDNVWARVMIDNGEMGFIRLEKLQKGIGKPVPDFSKVYSVD